MEEKSNFINNYKIINFIIAGIFGLVFIYSGIFTPEKNNYPIHSACKTQKCSSRGLSRAFSKIVRFEFKEAVEFNKNSIKVFLFFFIQFFLRIGINIFLIYNDNKYILPVDIVISAGLYFCCFYDILVASSPFLNFLH